MCRVRQKNRYIDCLQVSYQAITQYSTRSPGSHAAKYTVHVMEKLILSLYTHVWASWYWRLKGV